MTKLTSGLDLKVPGLVILLHFVFFLLVLQERLFSELSLTKAIVVEVIIAVKVHQVEAIAVNVPKQFRKEVLSVGSCESHQTTALKSKRRMY